MAQTPAEGQRALTAVERQRAAVERQRERQQQRAAVLADRDADPNGPMGRQRASMDRQTAKAEEFFALPWPASPPLPDQSPAIAGLFDCERMAPVELDPIVERSARDNSLTPELLRAVMRRESGFHPCAVSRAGAMGLMQLMPATAAALGVTDPFDPVENVRAGSRFLRELLERYGGNVGLALGAYNAGPGRVDRSGGIPPIAETRNYVRGILSDLGTGP
jgi:soluble lytic murein transglycosylase-like protein